MKLYLLTIIPYSRIRSDKLLQLATTKKAKTGKSRIAEEKLQDQYTVISDLNTCTEKMKSYDPSKYHIKLKRWTRRRYKSVCRYARG